MEYATSGGLWSAYVTSGQTPQDRDKEAFQELAQSSGSLQPTQRHAAELSIPTIDESAAMGSSKSVHDLVKDYSRSKAELNLQKQHE